MQTQIESAIEFRGLHQNGIFVLPCAWDCASARLFEEAGFPAVGTTSSGIAHSRGLPDGERIPVDEVVAAVRRIADAVSVPVSADFEAGYGSTHDEILDNVAAVMDAGAVGINLEDATGPRASPIVPVGEQVELIEAVRDHAELNDVPLVVNARTDVMLKAIGPAGDRVDRAVDRANRYLAAGADCAFVIGVTDRELIGNVVDAVDGPVNVLANSPRTPPVGELDEIGVARVSVGGGPMHAAMGLVRRIGEELRVAGTYSYLDDAIPHAEMQDRFGRRHD